MRWSDDLASSAELRRAYSALYGRYFARALMASQLGFVDFVSLNRDITPIAFGVQVKRLCNGDIPDWIAWDPAAGRYVLGEAKGSLTGRAVHFRTGQPACVGDGKKQFGRVEVLDRWGQKLATRGWVGASLWSTDHRARYPVSLLWDPEGEGREITEHEREGFARALRLRRLAVQANRLGITSFRDFLRGEGPQFEVIASPTGPAMPPAAQTPDDVVPATRDKTGSDIHHGRYSGAIITRFGMKPIRSKADLEIPATEPAMIFGIDTSYERFRSAKRRPLWLGRNGIAAEDGLSLFDPRAVEIKIA